MKDTVRVMQYDVFRDTVYSIDTKGVCKVMNTINAYSYVMAKKIPEFRVALNNADILVADGFPVVIAARLLKKTKIKKIAGADLFFHLMQQLESAGGNCFFLGSSDNILNLIQQRIRIEYPNVKVAFYSPPFRKVFSAEENNNILEKINEFSPDVLFVGMTAPKQELWVESHRDKLTAKSICSIGAVFDFYAGTIKRAPHWMISVKMEWVYRLYKEPRRMWKRYLIFSPLFFWDLFLYLIKFKK